MSTLKTPKATLSAAVASRAGAVGACLAACKAAESDAELVVPALRSLTAALQSDEARDEFREAAGMARVKQLATRHAGEPLLPHVTHRPVCPACVPTSDGPTQRVR